MGLRSRAGGALGGFGTTNDIGIKPNDTTSSDWPRKGLRWPLESPHSTLSDISVLKLKVDKCSRQDTVFMKKVSKRDLKTQQTPGGPGLVDPDLPAPMSPLTIAP